MSTRSTIRIKRTDGTQTGIYCHFDGYIEGVGVVLQLAYNTAEKVEKLLALGDLSTLGYYTEPDPEKPHDFEDRQKNVCCAYHRDRGEEFSQSNGENEFIYTFDENEVCWYVESEKYVRDTDGMGLLGLDYYYGYEKELLIDAILKTNIDDMWQDDEFAKKGEVVQQCIKQAVDARKEIIEKRQEEYEAYYRAYCD